MYTHIIRRLIFKEFYVWLYIICICKWKYQHEIWNNLLMIFNLVNNLLTSLLSAVHSKTMIVREKKSGVVVLNSMKKIPAVDILFLVTLKWLNQNPLLNHIVCLHLTFTISQFCFISNLHNISILLYHWLLL